MAVPEMLLRRPFRLSHCLTKHAVAWVLTIVAVVAGGCFAPANVLGAETAPVVESDLLRVQEHHSRAGAPSREGDGLSLEPRKKNRGRGEKQEQKGGSKPKARPQYPVPEVSYRPRFPHLGEYSLAGACQPIHGPGVPSVTLGDGETLRSAYSRLQKLASDGGGVLRIPWNAKTVQCDSLRVSRKRIMRGGVTIKGLTGPNGEQPRFYCRTEKRDGTIPHKEVVGKFMLFGETRNNKGKRAPANQRILVENLHVDGYKTAFDLPQSGHTVLRNNYVHHQMSNGIVFSNLEWPADLKVEICGNEVAHAGSYNTMHGFYLHRGLHPEGSAEIVLVDNVCHSTPYSSCFKSIANKHIIKGNRFFQSLDTDSSFAKRYSSMLIDVAACADNLIEGNEFHGHKPKAKDFGDILIGIRNRKTIVKGCDRPPYGSSQFNDPDYWSSLRGAKIFQTVIRGNSFFAGPDFGDRLYAITAMGTFPNEELRSFGPTKLLEPPPGWYERSRVYVSDNSYTGFAAGHLYRSLPPRHCKKENCGPPPSRQPDSDLIEVGAGEQIVE